MNTSMFLIVCGIATGLLATQAHTQEQNKRSAAPVRSFSWIYEHQPEPGKRTWILKDDERWYEYYPSGREAKIFDLKKDARVESCSGSIVSQSAGTALEVFVPDVGCRSMLARFRNGEGPWSVMGKMNEVNTASAPASSIDRDPQAQRIDCSKPEQMKTNADIDSCLRAMRRP